LWASTSTKNPAYPDNLYVDELIGPDTVNTLPPATLQSFMDHGRVAETLTRDFAEAQRQVAKLADLGIDLNAITRRLQAEGVVAFARPFAKLLESIAEKCKRMKAA
jgi:transaldolase